MGRKPHPTGRRRQNFRFLVAEVDKCLTIGYTVISGENLTNTMKEKKMTNEEFLAKVAEITEEILEIVDEED